MRCCLFALLVLGCGNGDDGSHLHPPGEHGGFIVALGRDHYHAEILFADGELRLFVLGQDSTEVVDIASQNITVYLRPFGDANARTIELQPRPQPGDAQGNSSLFAASIPEGLPATEMLVTVPSIAIGDARYRFSFATQEPLMPQKVSDAAEKELYLTPGGLYTDADIEANGGLTASEKFEGFISQHNMNPAEGARICPITATAANAKCTWIIDGQEYRFCCPPCVDEFLRRCKEQPEEVRPADSYIKSGGGGA